MVAVVAAASGVIAALAIGGSAGQAAVSGLIVGVATFSGLFIYHYLRAPTQIEAERARRLREWRDSYSGSVGVADKQSLVIQLTSELGSRLRGCWCRVVRDEGVVAEVTSFETDSALGLPGPVALLTWQYPASFTPSVPVAPGHYRLDFLMGDHVEPIHSAEWDFAMGSEGGLDFIPSGEPAYTDRKGA